MKYRGRDSRDDNLGSRARLATPRAVVVVPDESAVRAYVNVEGIFMRLHSAHTQPMVRQNSPEEIDMRSVNRFATPCEIRQSRSISPRRRPPSRDRPSVGCLVSTARGPLALACILSAKYHSVRAPFANPADLPRTICFRPVARERQYE